MIFRSRIRLLVNFMKFVYLDKKDRIAGWFTARRGGNGRGRGIAAGAAFVGGIHRRVDFC